MDLIFTILLSSPSPDVFPPPLLLSLSPAQGSSILAMADPCQDHGLISQGSYQSLSELSRVTQTSPSFLLQFLCSHHLLLRNPPRTGLSQGHSPSLKACFNRKTISETPDLGNGKHMGLFCPPLQQSPASDCFIALSGAVVQVTLFGR